MIPFLLVLLGLILILLEFYLPGAILGILGVISILGAFALFISEASSWIEIALFIVGTLVAVGLLIRFALWYIVHGSPQDSIYLKSDQEGYQASTYDKSAVGKHAVVVADLKPGGFIVVDGVRSPAISVSGYIVKGQKVEIIGGQEQSLMVRKI